VSGEVECNGEVECLERKRDGVGGKGKEIRIEWLGRREGISSSLETRGGTKWRGGGPCSVCLS